MTQVLGFSLPHTGIARALVTPIGVGKPLALNKAQIAGPDLVYRGLWDTGATTTMVTKRVVKEQSLVQVGVAECRHAQGIEKNVPVYLCSIYLPSKVVISEVRVIEGNLSEDTDLLVGMDIITLGDFAVSNFKGNTHFSFRMPSIERIELNSGNPSGLVSPTGKQVLPPASAPKPKVGRNAPCPCGSGKKYKKCCEQQAA